MKEGQNFLSHFANIISFKSCLILNKFFLKSQKFKHDSLKENGLSWVSNFQGSKEEEGKIKICCTNTNKKAKESRANLEGCFDLEVLATHCQDALIGYQRYQLLQTGDQFGSIITLLYFDLRLAKTFIS